MRNHCCFFSVLAMSVFLGSPVWAKEAACPSPFYLEPKPLLTLTDLGKLTDGQLFKRAADDAEGFIVRFFDEEDYPIKNGRRGVAVIIASNGDLGEPGLGGLLWSTVPAGADRARSKALDRTNGKVNTVFVAKEPYGGKTCGRASFTFTLDQPTGEVSANGRRLGSLNEAPK